MPSAALTPCTVPGCPALLIRGSRRGRCATHRRERERAREQTRPDRDRFYDTQGWRRFRKWFLARHPLCEMGCNAEGRTTAATDVDHIVSLAQGGAPLDESNVRAACHPCHSRHTATEQSGWGGMKSSEACRCLPLEQPEQSLYKSAESVTGLGGI